MRDIIDHISQQVMETCSCAYFPSDISVRPLPGDDIIFEVQMNYTPLINERLCGQLPNIIRDIGELVACPGINMSTSGTLLDTTTNCTMVPESSPPDSDDMGALIGGILGALAAVIIIVIVVVVVVAVVWVKLKQEKWKPNQEKNE